MIGEHGTARKRGVGARRLLALAGIAAIALTGCTTGGASGGDAASDPNSDEAIAALGKPLHPTGDPGAWFWNSYSNGLAGAYSTANEICGIGRSVPADVESTGVPGDIVVESQNGPSVPRVIGRSLSVGAVMWEIQNASCQEGTVVDDTVVVSGISDDGSWRSTLFSTQTGRAIMRLPAPNGSTQSGYAQPIVMGGAEDGVTDPAAARLFKVGQDTLMSVSPPDPTPTADAGAEPAPVTGKRNWATTIGPEIDPVPLGDGMIGITQRLSNRMSVVDSTNGKITFETTVADKHALTWLSDGYLLRENESDPAYVFYDLSGAKVERTVGDSQYRFAPGSRQGITYSIADQLSANTTVGVDAEGRPALREDAERRNQLRGATLGERDLPDSIISLSSVSRDGSLLLFPGNTSEEDALPGIDANHAVVIDQRGKRVIDWPLADTGVSVMSGYIVAHNSDSTYVLLPKQP